jgi:hypothetical protein
MDSIESHQAQARLEVRTGVSPKLRRVWRIGESRVVFSQALPRRARCPVAATTPRQPHSTRSHPFHPLTSLINPLPSLLLSHISTTLPLRPLSVRSPSPWQKGTTTNPSQTARSPHPRDHTPTARPHPTVSPAPTRTQPTGTPTARLLPRPLTEGCSPSSLSPSPRRRRP